MLNKSRSHNVYPHRRWTDDEAKDIIRRFGEAIDAIPELREGCLYFIGLSVPTDQVSEDDQPITRTAHYMTGHPHTAVLVGNGMATVYPILLSEMAGFLGKLAIAPAVIQLVEDLEEEAPPLITMPELKGQKPS